MGDPGTADAVTCDLRYVLVDEYQDTNYIQEQLLLKLTKRNRNLCVVGDEDQSLYRFRGATVRNILEFPQRLPGCTTVKLTTNYRSHRAIVERYDRWMASADWSNPRGPSFRYDKTIEADAAATYPAYPSVIAIWGKDKRDEAARFADLVEFLRKNEVIADYGQVALLLHSVREEHSGPYLAALEAKGIRRSAPAPARTSTFRRSATWSPASPCSSAGTATDVGRSAARSPSSRPTWTTPSSSSGAASAFRILSPLPCTVDRGDRGASRRPSARPTPGRLLLPPARARSIQECGPEREHRS